MKLNPKFDAKSKQYLTFRASSVLKSVPSVNASSASRRDKVFRIVAWNHVGATIPSCVSFRPMLKLGSITRYSQHMASKQPPAGECPYKEEQFVFETIQGMTILHMFTLMTATVANGDPYSLNQTSCRVDQNCFIRSCLGLYISIMSKPALKTELED